jgi:WhiB family transcriptional regulator, redox-sensing transcriptional regulator
VSSYPWGTAFGDDDEEGIVIATQTENPWHLRAACRGPQAEVFFPPTGSERKEERLDRERTAKAICRTCMVRVPCLDYAVSIREPHGIWGGMNEVERRDLIERRAG